MKFNNLSLLSLLILAACEPAGTALKTVAPSAETTPTIADSANDPAIWVDPDNPANSLILGSGGAAG
jgi:3-phytase